VTVHGSRLSPANGRRLNRSMCSRRFWRGHFHCCSPLNLVGFTGRQQCKVMRLVHQVSGITIDVRSRKLKDWIDYLVTFLVYGEKEKSNECVTDSDKK